MARYHEANKQYEMMEAATSFPEKMPGQYPETPPSFDANVTYLPPRNTEGVFDAATEQTSFDTQVVAIHQKPAEDSRYGEVDRSVYEMSDGTLYPVVTGTPKEPRSDTAIAFTTAWLTSTRGHNMRTFLSMMKHGYPVTMIGPEGEEKNRRHSVAARFKQALGSNMHKISHDMNRILDSSLDELDVNPDQLIAIGESRGSMEGFGFAEARTLAYGDFTAPCFPRMAKVEELPGVLLQLAPEAAALAKLGARLLREPFVKHYPATLHRDPEYYAKELLKVPMLLSGQAGELACKVDTDTPMHIRIFKNDGWSQAEVWKKLFINHSNVHLEFTEGHHLDIANTSTLSNITARLDALAEARGFDGDFKHVDFQPIIELHAHETSTAAA